MKYLFLFLIHISITSLAQNPIIKAVNYFPEFNTVYDFVVTNDNSVLITASTFNSFWQNSNCTSNYMEQFVLVKIDSTGNISWKKCLTKAANVEARHKSLIVSSATEFYLFTSDYNTGQGFIEKYNMDGSLIFSKQLKSQNQLYSNLIASNPVLYNNQIYLLLSNFGASIYQEYYLQKYSLAGDLVSQIKVPQITNYSNVYKGSSKLAISPVDGKVLLATYQNQSGSNTMIDVLTVLFDSNFNTLNSKIINRYNSDVPLVAGFLNNGNLIVSVTDQSSQATHIVLSSPNLDIVSEFSGFPISDINNKAYFFHLIQKDWDDNIILNDQKKFFKLNTNSSSSTLNRTITASTNLWSYILRVCPAKNKTYIGLAFTNAVDGFLNPNPTANQMAIIRFSKEGDCPDNFSISNTYTNNLTLNTIKLNAQSSHPNNKITQLYAEKSIELTNGFKVNANGGGTFFAEVRGCN